MTKSERRRRYGLLAVLGGVALAAGTAPLWGSSLGRRIEWLEVQRIEISGTSLVAPHEVFALSGIRAGHYLLDELASAEAGVRQHPGIANVSFTRKAPNTLKIRIEEKRPVAYVEGPELRLATGTGEILPHDPAAVPLDLPIVRGTVSDSAGVLQVRRLLGETSRLTTLDPSFMAEVSEVRTGMQDGEVIVASHRLGTVLLPFGVDSDRLEQLRVVLVDLEQRFPSAPNGRRPVGHRVDLRFGDQIVVLPSSQRERP